jgi:hypothetical protein
MKIAINILGVLILAFVATAFDCGGGGGNSNSGNNVPDPSFTGALPCQKQVKSPNGYDETYTDDSANHWDKDPRTGHTLLCAAGMMETGGGQMKGLEWPGMAVVDAVDKMPIIRYEGEHNLLAQVDPDRFVATQYHYGTNGGHPILGDGPTSLKGAKRKAPAAHDDTPQVKDGDGRTLFLVK